MHGWFPQLLLLCAISIAYLNRADGMPLKKRSSPGGEGMAVDNKATLSPPVQRPRRATKNLSFG